MGHPKKKKKNKYTLFLDHPSRALGTLQAIEPSHIPLSNCSPTLSNDNSSKGEEEGDGNNSQEMTKDKGDKTDEDEARQCRKEKLKKQKKGIEGMFERVAI